MRLIYFFIVGFVIAVIILWAGYFNVIKRKVAVLATIMIVIINTSLLLAAVLPQNNFYGTTITKVDTREKVIALTFDDGPYSPYTQELLRLLQEKKVKATFFMVGENAGAEADIVKMVAADGHEICLHANKHEDLLKLDKTDLVQNIECGKATLEKITGQQIKYMRPPHGFRDWLVMDAINSAGLTAVNWSVIPRDWTNPGVEVIADRVCKNVFPGAIVLLHDGDSPKYTASRKQTIQATAIIIEKLRNKGYRFVTVDELLRYKE